MEDRYLFKAKRADNGEWVEWNALTGIPHDISIRQDTICQCTDLEDKNGKLIWENDIVKAKYSDCFEEITEVAYSKNGYSPYLNEYECEGCCCYCEVTEIEIIGNIFDNPELIKESDT